MENVELLKIELKPSRFKSFDFGNDSIAINFEDDQVILSDYHDQDCCENVYADWEILKHYEKQIDGYDEYSNLVIKGVPEMGILLCFGDDPLRKVLIPCYNEQNGYYSTNLELKVKHGTGPEIRLDITNYVEDHIE
jgi:hypothetical protein